ncbi:MAG TPA: hypothetical protein ENI26_10245 [Methylophaga aminisulfidivorans]|nr:hypothetical protein [Methylophaga aminisulfidivorans]
MTYVSSPSQVQPPQPATAPPKSDNEMERRARQERRRRNKKPYIERRVSSDRRGPRFYSKA